MTPWEHAPRHRAGRLTGDHPYFRSLLAPRAPGAGARRASAAATREPAQSPPPTALGARSVTDAPRNRAGTPGRSCPRASRSPHRTGGSTRPAAAQRGRLSLVTTRCKPAPETGHTGSLAFCRTRRAAANDRYPPARKALARRPSAWRAGRSAARSGRARPPPGDAHVGGRGVRGKARVDQGLGTRVGPPRPVAVARGPGPRAPVRGEQEDAPTGLRQSASGSHRRRSRAERPPGPGQSGRTPTRSPTRRPAGGAQAATRGAGAPAASNNTSGA